MINKEHIIHLENRLNTYEEIPKSDLVNYSKTLVQYYFNQNNFKKANNYILMLKDVDSKPSWIYKASIVSYYHTDVFNFVYGNDHLIELLIQYKNSGVHEFEEIFHDLTTFLVEQLSFKDNINTSDFLTSLEKLETQLSEWSIDFNPARERIYSAVESYQLRQLRLESKDPISNEITQLEKRKEALIFEITQLEEQKVELELSLENMSRQADNNIQLKDIKITIIGASKVKIHHIDGIVKTMGFNPKKATYLTEYDKINTYDITRLKTYDERHVVLLGPTPHSAKGTMNYSSILTAIEQDEEYPKSFRILNDRHDLVITKSSLKSALSNVIQYLKSIDIK
jgi:hypothetical protein